MFDFNLAYLTANLCSEAYLANPILPLGLTMTGPIVSTEPLVDNPLLKLLFKNQDQTGTSWGFVCRNPATKTSYVVIPGTRTAEEWWCDFDASLDQDGVHAGAHLIYRALSFPTWTPGDDLVYTGHSLGGGIAFLLSLYTRGHSLYTWESMRVLSRPLAASYNATHSDSWRIENLPDIVPHLPLELAGYGDGGVGIEVSGPGAGDEILAHAIPSAVAGLKLLQEKTTQV